MDSTKTERVEHLKEEERRILDQLEELKKPVDFGSDVDGSDEETDESEEAGNRIGLEQMLRERLEGIRKTLEELG